MLLSSWSTQRSTPERLGTFSCSHASEEALKHVLKDACDQVHLEYSDTRLENPASNGRGENSVRAMKEMIQRLKDAGY